MKSQKEINYGIQLLIWGALTVFGLIGVICGAENGILPLMIGGCMLYASWDEYKAPKDESENQMIDNQ